jgi:3-deoxy-7-phosphoheptulonate synthase
VIVDPSHAAGVRSLVPVLARAAAVVGADGLLVEVHPDPDKALSDGAQSLPFEQFETMMRDLQRYVAILPVLEDSRPQPIVAGGIY